MLPSFAPLILFCFESVSQTIWRKTTFYKERYQLAENLRGARCSLVIPEVLAARMRKLITARARKNKRTARMMANAYKDHSIGLIAFDHSFCKMNSMNSFLPEITGTKNK